PGCQCSSQVVNRDYFCLWSGEQRFDCRQQFFAACSLRQEPIDQRPFAERRCRVVRQKQRLNSQLSISTPFCYWRITPTHAREQISSSVLSETIFEIERRQVARQRITEKCEAARSCRGTTLLRRAS